MEWEHVSEYKGDLTGAWVKHGLSTGSTHREVICMYHMEGNFWVTCQLPSLQTLLTWGCLKIKQDGQMRSFLSAGGGLGADGEQEQKFCPYIWAVASAAQAFLQFRPARHWLSNAFQSWACWQHGQTLTIMLRVRQCFLKYLFLN